MLFPDHFLSVRATVDAGREDDFNRWYNSEHIPDVVNMVPGCLGASSFKVMDGDGSHQYMALYAFRTAEELRAAIGSSEIKELIRRYDEAIGSFSTPTRKYFITRSRLISFSPQRGLSGHIRSLFGINKEGFLPSTSGPDSPPAGLVGRRQTFGRHVPISAVIGHS